MTIEEFKTEAEAVIENAMDSIGWYLTEYEGELGLDTVASIFVKTFKETIETWVEDLKESGVE